MWDATDPNGVKIVQELIAAAKSGGGYVRYTSIAHQGRKSAPKISYAVGVPEWQWYLGAGVFVDEIETVIAEKQAALNALINRNVAWRCSSWHCCLPPS